jgi:thiamine kinase-like enzyme
MPKPLGFKDFVAVDYTQTGDDQLAYNAKKRKKDIPTGNTGEEVELQAALNIQQRLKKARQMKKLAPKIALGRKRAARKMANMETLKKRAKKQARNMIAKKLTKGLSKGDLNMARRMEIEKRLDKMKPKIDKLAKKLLPKVRKAELARKKGQTKDKE